MGKVVYAIGVTLDGYIAGPGGDLSWSVPDEQLHRFHNERVRAQDAEVMGRRLYETMRYWDEVDVDAIPDHEREFADIWADLERYVVSHTLTEADGGVALERDGVALVERLRAEKDGEIGVGGAGLAALLMEAGLIDVYSLFVHPVAIGAGTRCFPPDAHLALRPAGVTRFDSGVVELRYERAS